MHARLIKAINWVCVSVSLCACACVCVCAAVGVYKGIPVHVLITEYILACHRTGAAKNGATLSVKVSVRG